MSSPVALIVGFLSASLFSQQTAPAVPPVGDREYPAPERDLNNEVDEDAPLGPVDPGPYPTMPGYFTRRARELNYQQTPFFNGSRGGYAGPFRDGGYGSQEYFPGVYPYYDAQVHYQWYLARRREQQLRRHATAMRAEGRDLFRDGEYERAAIRFLGAADMDQGDAAARVYAGHALFALGRYKDAVDLLRRAFELQPELTYQPYDARSDYGRMRDFDDHLRTLQRHLTREPQDDYALILMGYVLYYTDGPTQARPYLERAAKIAPQDTLLVRLLGVSSKASVNEAVARVSKKDTRPYDRMNVKSAQPQPYDAERYSTQRDDDREEKPAPYRLKRM